MRSDERNWSAKGVYILLTHFEGIGSKCLKKAELVKNEGQNVTSFFMNTIRFTKSVNNFIGLLVDVI